MKARLGFVLVLSICTAALASDGEITCRLTPSCSGSDIPVHARLKLAPPLARSPILMKRADHKNVVTPGQVASTGKGTADVWWVIPQLVAGKPQSWICAAGTRVKVPVSVFSWKDTPGDHMDLFFGGRLVARFMYAHDTSTPQRAYETYKPYLHVFGVDGKTLITKGPGGLYPHHRGIFIGWNRLACDGKRYDFWHMHHGVVQVCKKIEEATAGPVFAKLVALIDWNTADGKTIVRERREMLFFRQRLPNLLWLDFRTGLTAVGGNVKLDGDPEHGGFQFRPTNEVADRAKKIAEALKDRKLGKPEPGILKDRTIYLFHKEGVNPRKDRDLPWVAMSFVAKGQRYVVEHMNAPTNPSGTIYSAYRDYGRFGAFFKKDIPKGQTLNLHYGIWISAQPMPSRESLQKRWENFAHPPLAETR